MYALILYLFRQTPISCLVTYNKLFLQETQWGYYTAQRLKHVNDTYNRLYPKIHELDQSKIDINPIIQEIESLEQDSKNMNRNVNYSLDSSQTLIDEAENLREDATVALNTIRKAGEEVKNTIDEINELSNRLTHGEGKLEKNKFVLCKINEFFFRPKA